MQTSLEELLSLAATEPAHRPEFFQTLMASDVWLSGRMITGATESSAVYDLDHWEKDNGQSVIPFFTSESACIDATEKTRPRLKMPARALFEMTRGETLFLNPELSNGKEFTATEIEALLSGTGNVLSEFSVPEQGQTLLLSAVENPPEQLVASLKVLFARHKAVRRAFLAWCRESADQQGNLLIGIDASDDHDNIIQAAGHVAMDTLPEDAFIDFCEVGDPSAGVSHFFSAHITPFYQRPQGSFLRGVDLKGGSRIL